MSKFVIGQKVLISAGKSEASKYFSGKTVTVSRPFEYEGFNAAEEGNHKSMGGFWDCEAVLIENTQGVNPKDLIGQKKIDLSLVPPAALIYIAAAMEDGAKKYGPFNWRENKVRARVYLAAAMRHILAKLDGEDLAADSLKPHLAHAMACLAIYVDAEETGNLQDDRPTPGAAAQLIAKWEKKPETKKEDK